MKSERGLYSLRVATWSFPQLEEYDLIGAIRALAEETIRPVADQHIVSKVVLKRFAAPPSKGRGWQLARYDKVRGRELDPKGLNACAKVTGFVLYASGSAEQIWHEVENHLSKAIDSAENSTLHRDGSQVAAIRDALALHLVRSSHYRRVRNESFVNAMQGIRELYLSDKRAQLETEFRRRYGLDSAGDEALNLLLSEIFGRWREYERSGALLRVSIERNFYRVRSTLDGLSVEVLHAPKGRQFVISDAPAFTFHHDSDRLSLRMPIGDSHGIGMPVSSKCFVAIGPQPKDAEATFDLMDRLNLVQLDLAERQLYYRPDSAEAQESMKAALKLRA